MNQVVNRSTASTAVAALQKLRTGLQTVKDSLPATMGDPFLRMGKDGTWMYGQDNVEVQEGSLWAINPMSFQHGYACWTRYKDRNPNDKTKDTLVGEVMRPMMEPKPAMDTLKDTGWDWADQVSFQLKCMTGEDAGEQVLYKTTSVGGINAVKELIAEIMKQMDRDPLKVVPLVDLLNDSYMHSNYGKTYVPIFKIDHFVEFDGDGVAEDVSGETTGEDEAPAAAPAEAAAPRVRQRRAAATAAPQAQAEQPKASAQSEAPAAAPVRRRRVSA